MHADHQATSPAPGGDPAASIRSDWIVHDEHVRCERPQQPLRPALHDVTSKAERGLLHSCPPAQRDQGPYSEGTRQRSGIPGEAKPGAAMVAINEGVPIVPAAVYGSLEWNWNFRPVSVAFGEPMRFDTYARNSSGYRAATEEVMLEIRRLWQFLADVHRLGRPPATPPRRAALPVSFP